MNMLARFAVVALLLVGCNKAKPTSLPTSLVEARKGHVTKLDEAKLAKDIRYPVPVAPPAIFSTVKYKSPVGELKAYVTPNPKDGKKHPAIVWITGGDCNSINDLWSEIDPENEQSASAYRNAGIVMMFPSLRGGNDNPGKKETFYGEVDDVIATVDYLSKLPYVDPARIYLGGHSTGGTLALLVSECTDRFRAVFCFGPAADPRHYPVLFVAFDQSNPTEYDLRAPLLWLGGIKSPTFVIEGYDGNGDSVEMMRQVSRNPKVQFNVVAGADHFRILDPTNRLLATKITADTGPECNISLTEDELKKPFAR